MEKNTQEQVETSYETRFREMARIMHNLRFYTKYWNEHGGFNARKNMKYWEEKADACLDQNGLTTHNNTNSIKVSKD